MKIATYDDYEQRDSLLFTRDQYLQKKKQEQSAQSNEHNKTKEPPIKPYGGSLINNYASSLTGSYPLSTVIALDDFLSNRKDIKESKNSYEILKKIEAKDLPSCEYLDQRSHVGEFISITELNKIYEDDFDAVLKKMNDTSILCFCCVDGAKTWWAPKMDDGKVIGLVRTK